MILAVSEVTTDAEDPAVDELDEISADEDCATELLDFATIDVDDSAEDSATEEIEDEDSTTVAEEAATDDELFSPFTGAAPFPSSPQATNPTATKASKSNANLFILHLMRCNNCITKRVYGYFDTVNFTVPVFALLVDITTAIQNFPFAEFHDIDIGKFQVSLDAVHAHFGRVDFFDVVEQNLFVVHFYTFLIGWRITVFHFSGAVFRGSER